MFAIVDIAGFQEKVEEGQVLRVPTLKGAVGDSVTFDKVMLLSVGDADAKIGKPYVTGAAVAATIKAHGRADKIIVRKFKRRKRYTRTQGHRQGYTDIEVTGIKG